MSKNKTAVDPEFDEVVINLESVIEAYKGLLKKAYDLADSAQMRRDYVVGKVFPKTLSDRTNTKRIQDWFDKNTGWIKRQLELTRERRELELKRRELILKANLSEEDLRILGVEIGKAPDQDPDED